MAKANEALGMIETKGFIALVEHTVVIRIPIRQEDVGLTGVQIATWDEVGRLAGKDHEATTGGDARCLGVGIALHAILRPDHHGSIQREVPHEGVHRP